MSNFFHSGTTSREIEGGGARRKVVHVLKWSGM